MCAHSIRILPIVITNNFETDKFVGVIWKCLKWDDIVTQQCSTHALEFLIQQHCTVYQYGILMHIRARRIYTPNSYRVQSTQKSNEIENNSKWVSVCMCACSICVWIKTPTFRAAVENHWLCIYPVLWCLISQLANMLEIRVVHA